MNCFNGVLLIKGAETEHDEMWDEVQIKKDTSKLISIKKVLTCSAFLVVLALN